MSNLLNKNLNTTNMPDKEGYFGEYGGSFVPKALQRVMDEVAAAYEEISKDPGFIEELRMLNETYTGRPSPVYHAKRLTEAVGGAEIYLKREDLNHTGAHKINHALGEVLLAKRMGKKKVIAETGAGQHGVALATAAALLGLDCDIYMGEVDVKKEAPNVSRMKILGAKVISVTTGTRTLKDAVDEAFKAYLKDPVNQIYCIGSVVGPHPFPEMVRDFQSVIGIEEADIVEIVDHHRLAAPKMNNPIFICSEPVGSTCTIVYEQYVKWQVPLDALTATILLGGLVADTVMLKSPTTTDYDRFVAQELGKSAKIDDFDEFCHSLFSSSSSLKDKDPMSLISSDFKKYREHGVHFGIGQVEVGSLEEIKELKDTYLEKLREFRDREALSIAMLLVTDVFKEESVLLTTNFDKEYKIPYEKMGKGMYYLPGVLSRKKQLLPETLKVLED